VKKAKNIATYCKRVEKIATEDDKFMKDKKPIVLFGQGRKNDIRADCKCFIKKRAHNRSRPKASPPSDAATTAATSGVAVVTSLLERLSPPPQDSRAGAPFRALFVVLLL
jgi:hypothetical protein